jgi:HAD superfamily hydrolase (TIGR01509 family)
MQPIKCFIFDLDGTLVFNEQANFLAYEASFKYVGLSIKLEDFSHHFKNGGNIEEIYADFVSKRDLPYDEKQLRTIKDVKVKEYADRFHLIEQNHPIIGLLKALSSHYHTALATTSRKENGMGLINHFGLAEYFDFMIFGDEVTKRKPDPECHEKIARHFKVKPEECLIFEDSSKGFAAAEAFGAHICKVVR